MSWPTLLTLSFAGLAASMVANVLAVYQGNRYRKWLPKRDVLESLEALKLRLSEGEEELDLLREREYEAKNIIREAELQSAWMEKTREEVADLGNREKELKDVEEKLSRATDDWARADEKLTTTNRELVSAEDALKRQREQLLSEEELRRQKQSQEDLTSEVRELTGQQRTLTAAIEVLHSQRDEARKEREGLVSAVAELRVEEQTLKESAAGLTSRCESLEKQLDELKQRNQQLGGSAGAADEKRSTELLWEHAIVPSRFYRQRPEPTTEAEALENASKYIEDSGLQYDDRVIRAFHTSLKCADEAPLLVLAGISGTGKSALPTKYAEGMGMHFLNVPVQPGWDSPADLLGFYNHLEGRFRPTELTRALLQMDFVNKIASEGADEGSWPEASKNRANLSDRMLLVLLDEMNLARVEYYFSEFLSRLELRRRANPHSAKSRRDAELVLDLGVAGEGQQQSLRVFPGSNVLFVGTMNEDESTQSLSDKVIDRSNVMRFGRPNRLDERSQSQVREDPTPTSEYLSREQWRSWVKGEGSLGSSEVDRVGAWIQKVNLELTKVGRPFGYRVADAMHAYVRNYPRTESHWIENAFADQIELRVLPKLRGLDTHDQGTDSALDGISVMLDSELGDSKLVQALRDARGRSEGQLFHWSGVDRLRSDVRIHS